MNKVLPQNLGSFVWRFLKPYKRVVFLFMGVALLAGCWGPFNSMLIKYLINTLSTLPSTQENNLLSLLTWPAVLLVVNFIVFDNVCWRTIGFLHYKYQPLIKKEVIKETFNYVLGSSHQFFQDNLSGRISIQITTLADSIEYILKQIAADFLRNTSLLMIALVSMYYVNPKFSYTLFLWFIAFYSFSLIMSKRLVYLSDLHTESESIISGQITDSISNINNVRIFARRSYEGSRLEKFLLISKEKFQKKELFLILVSCGQGFLIAVMLGFMVYFLVHLYSIRSITIGDFALILGLGIEVAHISWYTMSRVDEFNQAVGKCKQSLSHLIVPQELKDKEGAPMLIVTKGQIRFSEVKFHYKNTEALFQNKSVTIEPGQKVGLVGYSGSGKSTFVNLILRLFDVTEGHITIDGQDISEITQDSLREKIGLIPQDPTLFHRTLMDNIRYGNIKATDEEVVEAAKKAHAHEFIHQLPQGYQSSVGERGIKLSGGQRQRIAIARAILKNAPILILDEATSQLDSVTEAHIQESLWELMQGKTTIVIAHRLSTLLHMDRILVFDKGKIVEDGNHAELLRMGGLYKRLWDAQVGGFLPDKQSGDE